MSWSFALAAASMSSKFSPRSATSWALSCAARAGFCLAGPPPLPLSNDAYLRDERGVRGREVALLEGVLGDVEELRRGEGRWTREGVIRDVEELRRARSCLRVHATVSSPPLAGAPTCGGYAASENHGKVWPYVRSLRCPVRSIKLPGVRVGGGGNGQQAVIVSTRHPSPVLEFSPWNSETTVPGGSLAPARPRAASPADPISRGASECPRALGAAGSPTRSTRVGQTSSRETGNLKVWPDAMPGPAKMSGTRELGSRRVSL